MKSTEKGEHVCRRISVLSPVAMSNLYTMACSAKQDPRQAVGEPYTIPSPEVRRNRARLILEEAFETVRALGFRMTCEAMEIAQKEDVLLHDSGTPDLVGIIDGCADTIYVATGCLMAMGVPDSEHLKVVCSANNNKFPGGVATLDEHGKYLKPPGWQPPNHQAIIDRGPVLNVREESERLIELVAILDQNKKQVPSKTE